MMILNTDNNNEFKPELSRLKTGESFPDTFIESVLFKLRELRKYDYPIFEIFVGICRSRGNAGIEFKNVPHSLVLKFGLAEQQEGVESLVINNDVMTVANASVTGKLGGILRARIQDPRQR